MAGLHFEITGDNANLMRKLRETEKGVSDTVKQIERSGVGMEEMFSRAAKAAAGMAASFSAKQLVQQVVQVRGEFQKLEVAFTTMLGNKEKADALMQQMVHTAATTPFDLQSVAGGAKQLLAYGIAAEDVNATLIRLGDIAAGLSIPLGDLVYLYGTTRAQGRLYTQDLNQFTGRGIPMIQELAKQFGVAESEIKGMVEAGKVGFPEVQKVIENLTDEGGKFGGLMEAQSKTIAGQISNIGDSFQQMFNNIGKANEGIINDALGGVSYLVENYEKVIGTLKVLIATYGGYKAALIAVAAWQKASITAGNVKAFFDLAKGITSAKDAMLLFNIATKANPFGLILGALSAVIAALSLFIKRQKDAEEAQREALKPMREEFTQTNLLVGRLKYSNLAHEERKRILEELAKVNPEIVKGIEDEATAYEILSERLGEYNQRKQAEISLKSFSMSSGFDKAVDELADARTKLDEQSSGIIGVYATLFERFKTLEAQGKDIPENISNLFNSVFENNSSSTAEKVEALFRANESIQRNTTSANAVGRSMMHNLFIGIDIKDYRKSLAEYNEAEEEYAERKEKMAARIEATANALYQNDEKARQSFIQSMNGMFFPGESGDNKQSDTPVTILPPDFDKQVAEAKQKLEKAQKELSDLKAGIAPVGSDEKFDFAKAIEEQEKSVKEAQERLYTLTGYDPKSAEEERKRLERIQKEINDAILKAQEDANAEELALERSRIKDKVELLEFDKEQELKAIDERIKAAKSEEEKGALERLRLAATKNYDVQIKNERAQQAKEEREELQKLLEEYATYAQAVKDVNDEYARKRELMQNADGTLKPGVEQGNIDELNRLHQEELDSISVQFASREAAFVKWSNALKSKTLSQLKSMLIQAEAALAEVDVENGDPETVARLRAEVATLTNKLKEMQGKADGGKASWADLQQVLTDSISTFEEIGSVIGGTAGEMISSFGQIAASAVGMANGIQAIGEAVSTAEKASAILAVISAAIKVVSFVTSGLRDNLQESKEATEAATRATREYNEALEALDRTRAVEAHTNIFGTDTLSEIATQYEQAKKLIQELSVDAGGMKLSDEDLWDFTSGMSGWANFSAKARKLVKELESGNVAMVSDMRSGWQKFWGTGNDNVFTLTADQMMTNGEFDGEKLRDWYEAYGEGLTEENKDIIEAMIGQWDEYQTALQSIADNISAMMGDMTDTVAEQLVDGFIETGDAVLDVEKAVGDLARSLAIAAVRSKLMDDVFNDELGDRMTDLIAAGDTEGALAAITSALDGANLQGIAEVLQGLDQYFDHPDEEGGSSDRTASQKGIAAASQDSVDENNARLTTIQGHTFSIMNGVNELNITANLMLERLAGIEANTAETNDKIDKLIFVSKAVSLNTETMKDNGLRLRR